MKLFLKVYCWTSILLFIFILEACYLDKEFFSSLWSTNNFTSIPVIYPWSIPVMVSLLASLIARVTTPSVKLLRCTKKARIINLLILIVCLSIVLVDSFCPLCTYFFTDERGLFISLLVSSCMLGTGIILLINSITFIKDAAGTKNIIVIAYAVFYSLSLLLSSFFVFGGIINNSTGINENVFDSYLFNYIFSILGILLLLTAGGTFGVWVWKKEKNVLTIVGIIVIGFLLYKGTVIIFRNIRLYPVYEYFPVWEHPIDIDHYFIEEIYTPEEVEEPEPVIKEEPPIKIEAFSFDFLWDDPESNQDSLWAAASFAGSNLHLREAWSTLTQVMDPDYFRVRESKGKTACLAIMKYLYDYRTRADLKGIADSYLPYLPILIPAEKYKKIGMQKAIRQLLFAHDDILDGTRNFKRFAEIGKVMEKNSQIQIPGESFEDIDKRYYEAIAEITNAEKYTEEFPYSGGIEYQRVTWAYSFWARRYQEGIHKDVHSILKSIQKVYGDL